MVYPFVDVTDANKTVNELEHEKRLWEMANIKGIDYVVTGNLYKKEAESADGGSYKGNIKYSISVLDGKLKNRKGADQMEYPPKKNNKKLGKNLAKIGVATLAVLTYRSYYYYGWNSYYSTYWAVNRAERDAAYLDRVFTATNNSEREKNYKKTTAIYEAFEGTAEELKKFIDKNVQLSLKINSITDAKKGAAKSVKIEGGENCKLENGDNLNVVLITTTKMGNGNIVQDNKIIGSLMVESVDNYYLSTCKVTSGGKEIKKQMEGKSENLFALTTVKDGVGKSATKSLGRFLKK